MELELWIAMAQAGTSRNLVYIWWFWGAKYWLWTAWVVPKPVNYGGLRTWQRCFLFTILPTDTCGNSNQRTIVDVKASVSLLVKDICISDVSTLQCWQQVKIDVRDGPTIAWFNFHQQYYVYRFQFQAAHLFRRDSDGQWIASALCCSMPMAPIQ